MCSIYAMFILLGVLPGNNKNNPVSQSVTFTSGIKRDVYSSEVSKVMILSRLF